METMTESEKIELKRNVKFERDRGEIRVLGGIVHNMGFDFGEKLTCKDFSYDEGEDELSCVISA